MGYRQATRPAILLACIYIYEMPINNGIVPCILLWTQYRFEHFIQYLKWFSFVWRPAKVCHWRFSWYLDILLWFVICLTNFAVPIFIWRIFYFKHVKFDIIFFLLICWFTLWILYLDSTVQFWSNTWVTSVRIDWYETSCVTRVFFWGSWALGEKLHVVPNTWLNHCLQCIYIIPSGLDWNSQNDNTGIAATFEVTKLATICSNRVMCWRMSDILWELHTLVRNFVTKQYFYWWGMNPAASMFRKSNRFTNFIFWFDPFDTILQFWMPNILFIFVKLVRV